MLPAVAASPSEPAAVSATAAAAVSSSEPSAVATA